MKNTFFVVCILALVARFGMACSCAPPSPPKKSLEQSTAVFVGKVVSIGKDKEYGRRITFQIQQTWKGTEGKTVLVTTGFGGGDCGYNFKTGKSYLVYAYKSKEEKKLYTGICSRTRSMADAQGDIKAIGPGMKVSAREK